VRCVLIYNPASGRDRSRRAELVQRVADALIEIGHSVEFAATTAPGSAILQAREAAMHGADVVFACGGDGTVHEVIQGLISEVSESTAILGVIPFGSANALARHMKLSLDPSLAAMQQIRGDAKSISIGKLSYGDRYRYFTVVAGAGPDGALAYKVLGTHKSGLGRLAYYLHAARLFLTRRFHPFEVRYCEMGSDKLEIQKAVSVMAVRIGNLGGLFSRLTTKQASVDDAHLRLLVLEPPAALSLPLWFASGWLNLHHLNPFLRFVNVTSFSCSCLSKNDAHVQADGEWLGHIPMSVSIIPGAIRILTPSTEWQS
jgi:diacylglycerol kinase (ATP)